ncbi:MAG: hypothetical protein ISS66_14150 [Desulfobacteraceae bacterium]|nr:hypothetical protein [Desulfobacteraceae bacterium]
MKKVECSLWLLFLLALTLLTSPVYCTDKPDSTNSTLTVDVRLPVTRLDWSIRIISLRTIGKEFVADLGAWRQRAVVQEEGNSLWVMSFEVVCKADHGDRSLHRLSKNWFEFKYRFRGKSERRASIRGIWTGKSTSGFADTISNFTNPIKLNLVVEAPTNFLEAARICVSFLDFYPPMELLPKKPK